MYMHICMYVTNEMTSYTDSYTDALALQYLSRVGGVAHV